MLKKLVLFTLLFGLTATAAVADIHINADGKSQKYPDGSTLNISAARNLTVDYYGVKCFIPKGQKISLRCSGVEENNSIFCSGKDFKGIKVGDATLVTDKEVSFTVSQDGTINVASGAMVAKDKSDNIVILEKGNSYKIDTPLSLSNSMLPVNKGSNQQYEQVQKDRVLSPSAPRN